MELLLGCGNNKSKQMWIGEHKEWDRAVTLDIDPLCNPTYVYDLNQLSEGGKLPPCYEAHYDEIHAYNVLEHFGRQGDYKGFFKEFYEYWRVLKPKGKMYIIVPSHDGEWAWGDPGHTRVFTPGTWSFLNQSIYDKDIGKTAMTDYRSIWKGNFSVLYLEIKQGAMYTILQKE